MSNKYFIPFGKMNIFDNNAIFNDIDYKKIGVIDKYYCISTNLNKDEMKKLFPGESSVYAYTSEDVDDGEMLDIIRSKYKNSFICVTEDEQYLEVYHLAERSIGLSLEIDDIELDLNLKKDMLKSINSQLKTNIYNECQSIKSVKKFLNKCPYKDFEQQINNEVIGQPVINDMIYNIYTYLESIVYGHEDIKKNNFIITGPSGSGKTYFIKTLKKVLAENGADKFPIITIDASSITQEGFKGKNISAIYEQIAKECGDNDTYAIVFLDELDKKMMPVYDVNGGNINKTIQGELLTFIEGSIRNNCDTNKCLFIGAGAFQCIRDNKKIKNSKLQIGFSNAKQNTENEYDISFDDILELGSIPEFLGRFTGGIYNFHKMDKNSIQKIILKITEEISRNEPVNVIYSSNGLEQFINLANTDYGIRMLRREIVCTLTPLFRQLKVDNISNQECSQIVITDIQKAEIKPINGYTN